MESTMKSISPLAIVFWYLLLSGAQLASAISPVAAWQIKFVNVYNWRSEYWAELIPWIFKRHYQGN